MPPRKSALPAPRTRRLAELLAAVAAVSCVPFGLAQSAPAPSASALQALSMEQLMNVEVTSVSKHPEPLSETASAIQVVTGDDIASSGATSLPEALRLASNLEVAQIDSRQWAITARGFNDVFADKMLVLIDGRTVYTPLYAGVYWDAQNVMLADLDRIEVISGPGATQWGSNAVNGVVNITTKSARDTQGGLLEVGGGSDLNDFTDVRYGGQVAPDVYYRVYGTYFDDGSSDRVNGSYAEDGWRLGQGGFRIDSYAAAGSTLTLQGDVYSGAEVQQGPDDTRIDGGNLLGRWARNLSDDSNIQIQAYYDRTYRFIPGSFTQTINTYDVDFQHRLRVGQFQHIEWGTEIRIAEDDIVNTPQNAFLPPDATEAWYSAFLQDELALADNRLRLTAGSKLEHNDYTGFELQPSLRAAWMLDPTNMIWAAVSRAVRTPSRIDVDLYSPAMPPYRIAGGPGVVSEKLLAWELGYRAQVSPRLSFSLSTYYNFYSDLRSLEPLDPPAPFPVVLSSGLEGHSSGAELASDWRVLPGWRLHTGYTEMRIHTQPESDAADRSSGASIARDPNRQTELRSILDLSENWEWDAGLRYVGPISNQSVPGYLEMDQRIAWRPSTAWELSIDGQNLLHNRHAEFNLPGDRLEIPRTVYGKVSWHF